MKFSEKEIQRYIWDMRDSWYDLLLPADIPTDYPPTSPLDISVEQILSSLTYRKLKELYESLELLQFWGVEVPLEKQNDSTIRADFLASIEGSPGIAIIELKKSTQTEREALTELLAYSSHINSIFPTHCADDNILILIAPMEVRTVREAYLQSLIFDQKKIFALTPTFADPNRIDSLKLKPYIPKLTDLRTLSRAAFAKRNFDVHVHVWDDVPGFWNPQNGERNPNASQSENLNRVSSFAAQLMESQNIHGFTYTQQAWPELNMPFPNSLVVVGFNPYKIANDQLIHQQIPNIKQCDIPYISESWLKLSDFIPGLNKTDNALDKDWDYLDDLDNAWSNHLYWIGRRTIEMSTLTRGDKVWSDIGRMSWEQYESNFMENIACTNLDIRPTGILRNLYWETTRIDYEYWKIHDEHPIQGDAYYWALESLVSHYSFSEFLSRMFGDPFELGEI